jgi:hypothetical protein
MESSLEAEKIQIEFLNNKFVIGLSLVVSNVYLCLIERGPIFVFLHFQTDLAGPRKNVTCPFIIQPILTKVKINRVLLALSTKMPKKFSQAGCQNFQVDN